MNKESVEVQMATEPGPSKIMTLQEIIQPPSRKTVSCKISPQSEFIKIQFNKNLNI